MIISRANNRRSRYLFVCIIIRHLSSSLFIHVNNKEWLHRNIRTKKRKKERKKERKNWSLKSFLFEGTTDYNFLWSKEQRSSCILFVYYTPEKLHHDESRIAIYTILFEINLLPLLRIFKYIDIDFFFSFLKKKNKCYL